MRVEINKQDGTVRIHYGDGAVTPWTYKSIARVPDSHYFAVSAYYEGTFPVGELLKWDRVTVVPA